MAELKSNKSAIETLQRDFVKSKQGKSDDLPARRPSYTGRQCGTSYKNARDLDDCEFVEGNVEIGPPGSEIFVTDMQWTSTISRGTYKSMATTLVTSLFPIDVLLKSNFKGGKSKLKKNDASCPRYDALVEKTIKAVMYTLAHAELKAEKARNTSDLSSSNEQYRGTRYNRKTNRKQSPAEVLSDIESLSDTTSVHSTFDTNEFPSVEGLAPSIATRSPPIPPKTASETPFTAIKLPDKGTKCITKDTEFTKQIFKEINAIQLTLNDIMDNVSFLLKCKRSENELPMRANDVPDIIHSFLMDEKSPIDVERWLESDAENKKVLAKELSHIGGSTVKEVTRRIMYRVFTNEVGSQYSWEGAKKKIPFKKLAIASTILTAVRLSKTTSDSNEAEVIVHIKAWLVRCTERMKNNTAKLNDDTTGKINGDRTEVGRNNKPKDRGSEVEDKVRDRAQAGKKNEPENRGRDVDDGSRDGAEVGKKGKSKDRGSDHSEHSFSDRSGVRAQDGSDETPINNTPTKEPTRADKSAKNRNETTRVKKRIESSLPNSDDEIIEASIEDRSRTRSD